MAKTIFIEPKITIDENERRLKLVEDVLKKIVRNNNLSTKLKHD